MMYRPKLGVAARHFVGDHQIVAAAGSAILLVAAAISLLSAPSLLDRSGAASAAADVPVGIARLLGIAPGRSLDTGVGHLNASFLSIVVPIVLIAVGAIAATNAVAGAQRRGELDVLMAQPLTRGQLLAERFLGVVICQIQALLPGLVLIAIGSQLGDIDVSAGSVLIGGLRGLLLAAFVAAVVTAVSAATGDVTISAVAAGLTTVIIFGLIAAHGSLADISPVQLALGETPAESGPWTGAAILASATAAVVMAGVIAFDRRDIV